MPKKSCLSFNYEFLYKIDNTYWMLSKLIVLFYSIESKEKIWYNCKLSYIYINIYTNVFLYLRVRVLRLKNVSSRWEGVCIVNVFFLFTNNNIKIYFINKTSRWLTYHDLLEKCFASLIFIVFYRGLFTVFFDVQGFVTVF